METFTLNIANVLSKDNIDIDLLLSDQRTVYQNAKHRLTALYLKSF